MCHNCCDFGRLSLQTSQVAHQAYTYLQFLCLFRPISTPFVNTLSPGRITDEFDREHHYFERTIHSVTFCRDVLLNKEEKWK